MANKRAFKGFNSFLRTQLPVTSLQDFSNRIPGLWLNFLTDFGNRSFREKTLRYSPRGASSWNAIGIVYCGHHIESDPSEYHSAALTIKIDTMAEAPNQRPDRNHLRKLLEQRDWLPNPELGVKRVNDIFGMSEVMKGQSLSVYVPLAEGVTEVRGDIAQPWYSFWKSVGSPLTKVLWPV